MTAPNLADPAYHRALLAAELTLCERGVWTIELRLALHDDGERAWQPTVRAPYDVAGIRPSWVSAEQIRARRAARPAAGIGIVCGPQPCGRTLIALDEDVPGALAALATQHSETVTDTWRQRTRRSWHYLYWLSAQQALVADLALRNIKLAGIDVRAHHAYVVGAPTYHRALDGTKYIDNWREPAEMPNWLYRVIRERSVRVVHVDDSPGLDDAAIEREYPYSWRRYCGHRLCETHAPAVQGDHGSRTAMWLAGALVTGLVLRRDDAIALMRDVYSARCLPPWSPNEVKHMVNNAIARPRRPRGWMLADPRRSQSEEGRPRAPRPPTVRAEIVCVDERPGRGGVHYQILGGAHAGQSRRRPMAWPPTPQSERLWSALAAALGLDQIAQPHQQCWRRVVRVEIIGDATYGWRIGRVYPDDAQLEAQPTDLPSTHTTTAPVATALTDSDHRQQPGETP